MLSIKTLLVFSDMVNYCTGSPNKTALLMVPDSTGIKQIFTWVKNQEHLGNLDIELNVETKRIRFGNGSVIIIRTPHLKPEQIRGLELDFYEEFGLASYETWRELKLRSNKSCGDDCCKNKEPIKANKKGD